MSEPLRRRVAATVLDLLAEVWPNPMRRRNDRLGTPGTDEYERGYTREQYMERVAFGLGAGMRVPPLWGLDVLEIGCGPGGITCLLASLGARHVVGIDLGDAAARYGRELATRVVAGREVPLPVSYVRMDAHQLAFREGSFDLVYADNAFEHFTDPERVMNEAFRVLRPGGRLLVPIFSSIWSKHGLHLKQGLKVPWANLVFDEETIVETMRRRAQRRPKLLDLYPGIAKDEARRVRDLRRFGDLNDMTHARFREMATRTGFEIETFQVHATRLGRLARKLAPQLEASALFDVLSTGAGAILRRPAAA